MKYISENTDFDRTYLIVSPQNPLKDCSKVFSAQARYDAAVAAVKRHPGLNASVDDIELRMEPPYYTIRTLDALKKREPKNEFTLIIGADNLSSIRLWKDYRRILSEYGVAVFPRKGFDSDSIRKDLMNEASYKIVILEAGTVDISSTSIREDEEKGLDVSDYLM